METKLNSEQVTILSMSFISKKVHSTLLQMNPIKAPRPYGMPILFYSKFWHIMGSDVTILCAKVKTSQENTTSYCK